MKYTNFHIQNYKGIKDLKIDLNVNPDFKIYSFIGLNESGKTTILEAINDCEKEVPSRRRHELIPKGEAGGFTGSVMIQATIELDKKDQERIVEFINQNIKPRPFKIKIEDSFKITRKYGFINAESQPAEYSYNIFVSFKKTKSSKDFTSMSTEHKKLVWEFVHGNLFPEIIFYRDFLSKFPEKVYLEPVPDNNKDEEYLGIIEDVLTSINANYSVESSLLNRLKNISAANTQALEAVENQLGSKISLVVFDAWNKIQNVRKKEIVAKTGIDEDGRYYIKFTVKDGGQSYSVSERSLGFRWFFTFLLYTEFRKERMKGTGEILFLLDEPASNLHQEAQKSLLNTFENIVTKSRLAYTTHSHHLINPKWLENAYVVKNNGLNYVGEDNFKIVDTEIEAKRYKVFASDHPDQTSYFQPILDVLDYQPGLLEKVPKIVIVEGKFDFSTFNYFLDVVLKRARHKFSFYPGQGATKLDLPISLYESWSREYIAILDSDKEGKGQKARYIKEISTSEKIFTLEDIDSKFSNISTEDLFTENEKLQISKVFNSSLNTYNKSAFNTGIQMLAAEKKVPGYLTKSTVEKIEKIINFIDNKF